MGNWVLIIFTFAAGLVGGSYAAIKSDGNIYASNPPNELMVYVATTTQTSTSSSLAGGPIEPANNLGSNSKTSSVNTGPVTIAPLPSKPTQTPQTPPTPPEKPAVIIPLETLNESVRKAMVNVLCTTKSGGDLQPLSGSGIIIDPRGVILTNAHVAQYMLLKDYPVEDFITCIARSGSPAMPAYKIELLYLPENWLNENAALIQQENPLATGENDFALLLIAGVLNNSTLPASLPFVSIETDQSLIRSNVPVLLAGYASGFLGGIQIQTDLWLTTSPSVISSLFFFTGENNIDAFSVGSNILAQKGVSGGAAVYQHSGKVAGILTTITEETTTSERDLTAISLAHIDRSYQKNTGKTLAEFLSGDTNRALSDFKSTQLPALSKKLIDALKPQ